MLRPPVALRPGIAAGRAAVLLVRPVMTIPASKAARAGAKKKVAERIASSLRRAIVEGRLKPGDALPSERELAGTYEANRSSVREAMKRLEAWGLVNIRHGGATRVADFFLSAGTDLVPYLFEVAAKADPASLARLEELARRLEQETRPAALQELDYDFFQALVAVSGNRILALVANLVREIYSRGKERFAAMYEPGVFDAGHHRRAAEAIRRRDAKAAGDAMRAHAATALATVEER